MPDTPSQAINQILGTPWWLLGSVLYVAGIVTLNRMILGIAMVLIILDIGGVGT